MKLLSLKLKNFKGIKEFQFVANGESINIYGENATGKTTIFDALIWLLFDKDSQNRNNFEVKTLDEAGSAVHRLEHQVEGHFLIDGIEVVLQKIYKEKWTRTRGQAVEKFSGHTTDYFIDEVPCKTKREYDTAVSQMIDEKVFKLLTNPLFFNENIEWGERRGIILKVCGDISENDVIEQNKSLADLKKYLNGKSVADLKAVAAAKQSKINGELKMVPARISELQNNLQEIIVDEPTIKSNIQSKRQQLEEKNKQILLAENGGVITQLQLDIKTLGGEIQDALNRLNKANNDAKEVLQTQWFGEKANLNDIVATIRNLEYEKKNTVDLIKRNDESAEALRSEFAKVSDKVFKIDPDADPKTCSYCGQGLPKELLAHNHELIQKEQEDFNESKANKLVDINSRGKVLVAESQASKHKLQQLEIKLSEATENRDVIIKKIDQLALQIKAKQDNVITTSPAIEKLEEQQNIIRQKISNQQEAEADIIESLKKERNLIQTEIEALERQLSDFNQSKKTRERIAELEEQQVTLAREYEQLSQQIFLAEEFTKRKVDMLQEKINSKFAMARFKMFSENVTNDGISECCETTLAGVPYKDLNNAAKINVGLDIIQTLAAYYNFEAPIFIDNAEAVTRLIYMGSTQIIRLIVSEQDKVLRIETKQAELREAI